MNIKLTTSLTRKSSLDWGGGGGGRNKRHTVKVNKAALNRGDNKRVVHGVWAREFLP